MTVRTGELHSYRVVARRRRRDGRIVFGVMVRDLADRDVWGRPVAAEWLWPKRWPTAVAALGWIDRVLAAQAVLLANDPVAVRGRRAGGRAGQVSMLSTARRRRSA